MKKMILAVISLLTLALGSAQLIDDSSPLPGSVREYLNERETMTRLLGPIDANMRPATMSRFVPSRMENGVEMIDAFIAVDGKGVVDALRKEGVAIGCEFDGFVTARIPVNRLAIVSKMNGVLDVEISRVMDLCTDSTMSVTHAGQVINGLRTGLPDNYDGSGVIVGLIDFGFDYRHSAFKSSQDPTKSRIVRVYDPQNITGYQVKLGDNILAGSVLMGAQIDTMTTDVRGGSHGTHTASIAAGRHMGGYGGMAPGADIVLCTSRTLSSGLSETEVVNCMKYIYSYADSVGKPCVISLSVSTNAGSHDGKDYLSKAVKQLVGPGRIFVIAAGNNGFQPHYVHGPAKKTQPVNILVDCSGGNSSDDNYYYSNVLCESWVRATGTRPGMKFHILDKRTNKIVWESELVTMTSVINSTEFSDFFEPDASVSNVGYLRASIAMNVNSSKFVVSTTINNLKSKSYYTNAQGKIISNYRIGLSVFPRFVDSCYVDNWMGTGVGRFGTMTSSVYVDSIPSEGDTVTLMKENYYAIPDNSASIGSYAVSDSVISVGSFIARNTYFSVNRDSVVFVPTATIGAIYYTSSYESPGSGPTGQHLPTVTAPGYCVVAAGSRYSYFNSEIRSELVMRDDEGSVWGIMTGTSMACPTVAGIVAQWLQLNPNLSPSQIKNIIAQTAIKDDFTNASVRFGPNGKIDALAGIAYLINNDPNFVIGDVNGDGLVSIKDVTVMIDKLLEVEMPVFRMPAADMNQDGEFTIKDVTMLIDFLLGAYE